MQTYDLIMLIVLGGATILGAWKGMAWQVASLASIGVSYFVAVQFYQPVAAHIGAAPPWNQALAMLLLEKPDVLCSGDSRSHEEDALDLAVVNADGATIDVFYGTGNGSFSAGPTLQAEASPSRPMLAGSVRGVPLALTPPLPVS